MLLLFYATQYTGTGGCYMTYNDSLSRLEVYVDNVLVRSYE
jgi:hypothetical protein